MGKVLEKQYCLVCGHEFYERRPTEELSKGRQCGRCWSRYTVSESELKTLVDTAAKLVDTTILGWIPLFDVIEAVFSKRGVRLTPIVTARLILKVYHELRALRGKEEVRGER